jgi:hypothetical protein
VIDVGILHAGTLASLGALWVGLPTGGR